MKNQIKYILILLAAAMLSGCLNDTHDEAPQNAGGVVVELTAAFEDMDEVVAKAATRAMTADQEDYVETLDVLVFEFAAEADGKGRFLYATHGYDIRNTPGSNDKQFKAMLATMVKNGGTEISLVGTQTFLLVLANSRNIWDAVSVSYGDTFKSVVDKLIYHAPDCWDTSSPRYFPMSSRPSARVVLSGSINGSSFGILSLIRSVTAINVGFNYNAGNTPLGFDNFKLKEVVFGQFPDKGYVSGYIGCENTFTSRVPSDRVLIDRTYTLATPSRFGIFNETYLPIVRAADLTLNKYPYLLIGGYYSAGGSENTTNLSWYRIDMPVQIGSSGSTGMTEHTERNWKYTFQIQDINGPGYATQKEAAAGAPNMWANMTVVPWSKSRLNAELDGPYKFDVSKTEFVLDSEARTDGSRGDNTLSLYTDYAYGWKVDRVYYDEDPGGYPWIDPSILAGDPFVNGEMVIKLLMNTGPTRTGYIDLSAGRWKYTVKITQESHLRVTPASRTISFWAHRNGPMPHNTFVVDASGFDGAWTVNVTYPDGTLDWGLTALKTSDGKGFYVQCDPNTTLDVRRALVTVTSTGAGRQVVVPIIQDWADCGIAGRIVEKPFVGGKSVKTHIIGGNVREMQKPIERKNYSRKPIEEYTDEDHAEIERRLSGLPYGDTFSCWNGGKFRCRYI